MIQNGYKILRCHGNIETNQPAMHKINGYANVAVFQEYIKRM